MDDKDFTIPYVTDKIPNSLAGSQLTTQARKNVWMVAINGEDTITAQVALDELDCHQNPRGKCKFGFILSRRKIY